MANPTFVDGFATPIHWTFVFALARNYPGKSFAFWHLFVPAFFDADVLLLFAFTHAIFVCGRLELKPFDRLQPLSGYCCAARLAIHAGWEARVPHRQEAYVPTGALFCASSTARLIAAIMLSGCAISLPAISNAVP